MSVFAVLFGEFLAAGLLSSISYLSNSVIVYISSGMFSLATSQLLGPLVKGRSMLLLKSIQGYVGI